MRVIQTRLDFNCFKFGRIGVLSVVTEKGTLLFSDVSTKIRNKYKCCHLRKNSHIHYFYRALYHLYQLKYEISRDVQGLH